METKTGISPPEHENLLLSVLHQSVGSNVFTEVLQIETKK